MSAVLSTPKTTSGGEIITHLINATDGAGLHFDGTSGNVALASPPPNLGTKFSFEFVIQADEWGVSQYISDFGPTNGAGRLAFFSVSSNSYNLGFYDSAYRNFGVKVLDDLKVHHLVFTIDGTSAILYDNGNQVATVPVDSPTIDQATVARIGSYHIGSSGFFNGTIYRARLWNKTLSQAEITSVYESASIDFADQWGEQNLVDAAASVFTSGTYSWTAYGTNTIANVGNALAVTYGNSANGAYNYLRNASDLTKDLIVGKKYRLTVDAKYAGGSAGSTLAVGSVGTAFATLTTSMVTYTTEFTATLASTDNIRCGGMSASNVVTIDNWYLDEIGCVSDFDFSYANPTQSDIVRNRNDTVTADGTAAGGVTQITAIDQLNSRSARIGTSAATPAEGEIKANALTIDTTVTGGAVIDASGQTGTTARLELKSDRPSADQDSCDIRFYNNNAAPIAHITAVKGSGANDTDGKLDFYTSNAKRLTIDSTGNSTFSGDVAATTISAASAAGGTLGDFYANGAAAGVRIRTHHASTGSYYDASLNFEAGSSGTSTRDWDLIASNTVFKSQYEGATITELSATGLAVTGAVSATGNTTVGSAVAATNVELNLNGVSLKATRIQFQEGGVNKWLLGQGAASETEAFELFNAAGVIVLQVDRTSNVATFSNGIAVTTGGIQFPATQSASADPNNLDEYEEGVWVPLIQGSGASGTYPQTTTQAFYTRVGRVVTVEASLVFGTPTAGSGNIWVRGLPFTSIASSNTSGSVTFSGVGNATSVSMIAAANSVLQVNDDTATPIALSSIVSGVTMKLSYTYTV